MILLVDGCNLAFRNFAALQSLRARGGEGTGGIFGTLMMLRRLVSRLRPQRLIVCWDYGASKWRKALYPEYKANRHKGDGDPEVEAMFEDYRRQLGEIRTGLDYLGVTQMSVQGVEADDMIGIVSHQVQGKVFIVSSDKDFYQLLDGRTSIVNVGGRGKLVWVTLASFVNDFGIPPTQWPEVRALTGDKSDNIPGIAGIGPKRALELIKKHGSIFDAVNGKAPVFYSHGIEIEVKKVRLYWQLSKIIRSAGNHYIAGSAEAVECELAKLYRHSPINKDGFRDWCFQHDMMTIHRSREAWFGEFGGR